MRLLRMYVLREHLNPFAVTAGGLTAALLVGNIIFKFAELVIAKGVGLLDILRLLIYLVPHLLSFTIPMACLIAVVLAFGRLSTDYELIAVRASGIAPMRLIPPMLVTALVISGGLLILNDRVVPHAHLAFRRQLKAIGVKQPTAYLEAGTFIKEFAPYIIFVYQIEGEKLFHVRIYEPQPNGPTRTIVATHGAFESSHDGRAVQLNLYDGTIDEWDPEHPGSLYKVSFTTYSLTMTADTPTKGRLGKKVMELTFRELDRERQRMKAEGIETTPLDIELHRKIASSFAPVIFILFGLALGLGRHHHERLISFVWVLALLMAYYLSMLGMNAVALKGWVPAWLTMWIPNLLGATISVVFLARVVRR
ncbi:MAG: LptF/LptG family permease [Candidatus Omnitrophica bacterium]|nr:LptF/LptG family permease [Candidatus Omnitrophota bacterium]